MKYFSKEKSRFTTQQNFYGVGSVYLFQCLELKYTYTNPLKLESVRPLQTMEGDIRFLGTKQLLDALKYLYLFLFKKSGENSCACIHNIVIAFSVRNSSKLHLTISFLPNSSSLYMLFKICYISERLCRPTLIH